LSLGSRTIAITGREDHLAGTAERLSSVGNVLLRGGNQVRIVEGRPLKDFPALRLQRPSAALATALKSPQPLVILLPAHGGFSVVFCRAGMG